MNTNSFSILRMAPMVLVMGAIFFLSHLSGDQLNIPQIPNLDKAAHFIAYGILAATVLWVPPQPLKDERPKLVATITVFFCFLYGISDEFHQSYIPGRSMSGADVIADLCGIMLVCAVWAKKYLSDG